MCDKDEEAAESYDFKNVHLQSCYRDRQGQNLVPIQSKPSKNVTPASPLRDVSPAIRDVKPALERLDAVYQLNEVRLPGGYQPHPFDVICRNDRERVVHRGNDFFLDQVAQRVEAYASAPGRMHKSAILRDIIREVRLHGGRFIRQEAPSPSRKPARSRDSNTADDGGDDDDVDDDDGEKDVKYSAQYLFFDIGSQKAAHKAGHAMRLALSRHIPKREEKDIACYCNESISYGKWGPSAINELR